MKIKILYDVIHKESVFWFYIFSQFYRMYMKYILALVILLFIGCTEEQEPKKIRVSGEGKIRAMPNQVTLTLQVGFTQPRMADAVKMTQNTIDSVIDILAQFGRRNIDIKTSSISANKHYEYIRGEDRMTGYSANQSIDFVLNDINKFTELTGKILETKISSISNIQFGHSKADSILREVDLLAYDDALKSADKLCKRANVKIGNLLYISNTYNSSEPEYSTGETIHTFSKAYGGRGFRISPEVIVFRRGITAEYEITE